MIRCIYCKVYPNEDTPFAYLILDDGKKRDKYCIEKSGDEWKGMSIETFDKKHREMKEKYAALS